MSDVSERAKPESSEAEEFSRQAAASSPGLVRELIDFLGYYKKWWLAPILVAMALLGFLLFLGSSGSAPFIYTLF